MLTPKQTIKNLKEIKRRTGFSNRAIARELKVSPPTVNNAFKDERSYFKGTFQQDVEDLLTKVREMK
jgi:DNA-binding NarL/FixJ family response regulator